MTTTKTSDQPAPAQARIKSSWLNLRSKRCWLLIALLLYTLLGFFAVPAIIKSTLTDLVEQDLERNVTIQSVAFNPYVLSLRIQQLEIRDKDEVRLAAFDDFYVNFQLSSLFRWALVFREIRLDNSYFLYERFTAEDSRISRLLADAASNRPAPEKPEPAEEQQGTVPRLLIHELALNGGAVEIRDQLPANPVAMTLGPININIKELNTLPDLLGKQNVEIGLPDDARLQWQGNLSLTPLESSGEMSLSNANLAIATPYLQSLMPLESLQALLSSSLEYHVRLSDKGELALAIDQLAVELDDVALTGLTPNTEFFALKQLALEGGSLRYPEQRVALSSLRVSAPRLKVWRKDDGEISINDLLSATDNAAISAADAEGKPVDKGEDKRKTDQANTGDVNVVTQTAAATKVETETKDEVDIKTENSPPARPWQLELKQLLLEQGNVDYADYSIKPNAHIGIQKLVIKASDISNQPGALIPLKVTTNVVQGGDLALDARLQIMPQFALSGQLKSRALPLSIAQAYVQQFVRLQMAQGQLNTDLAINLAADNPLSIKGALHIPDLEIKDTIESERLLGWKNLTIDQLDYNLVANKLALSPLQFEQLFGRIIIHRDKSTNLSGLVIEQDEKSTTQAAASKTEKNDEGDKFDLQIGGVNVKQSALYFSDLSLPLPFATRVEDLNGSISTIATQSTQPATIKLEGQVEDYGLAQINGNINLLEPLQRTAISVQFNNLLMSSLTPYTVEFVGRKIAEGKLNLDLNYQIANSQLQASNNVLISDLQLGDRVDNPNAASLPLGLAVALLKDASGKIDISLPIEGNIDDPQFRIGGIIWQAFSGLIVKAAASPFSLLGSLIGVEHDDFGQFQFLAGRADLTPPELEKVAQLKQALQQRPKLQVEIKGAVAPKIDRPALQLAALHDLLSERLGERTAAELKDADILDERFFKPLKALFEERFPDASLKTLRQAHTKPPADDPEGRPVLDEPAYAADLRDRLLTTIEISEAQLNTLAQARAQAIKDAFLTEDFDVSQIAMAEPITVKSKDGQWVKFELGVGVR